MIVRRTLPQKLFLYLALALALLFAAWPIAIMMLEGFSIDLSPFFSGEGIRFVGGVPFYSGGIYPTLVHYMDQLTFSAFPRLVLDSTMIALLSIGIAMSVGIPAAYALARLRIKGKSAFSFLLLTLRTASPFALVLPLYLLFVRNGLWDTYLGMGLAYLVVLLPVVVWLVKGFMEDIPRSTYDAAELFGASDLQTFRRVVLPLIIPGLVVIVIFSFCLVWNEFLFANALTGPVTKTVSVGVWAPAGENVAAGVNWEDLNAAGTLAFIPVTILILLIRKYLARGFSLAMAR